MTFEQGFEELWAFGKQHLMYYRSSQGEGPKVGVWLGKGPRMGVGWSQLVIWSQMLLEFVGKARTKLLPGKLEVFREIGAEEH